MANIIYFQLNNFCVSRNNVKISATYPQLTHAIKGFILLSSLMKFVLSSLILKCPAYVTENNSKLARFYKFRLLFVLNYLIFITLFLLMTYCFQELPGFLHISNLFQRRRTDLRNAERAAAEG